MTLTLMTLINPKYMKEKSYSSTILLTNSTNQTRKNCVTLKDFRKRLYLTNRMSSTLNSSKQSFII